jgi:hypothetical protein
MYLLAHVTAERTWVAAENPDDISNVERVPA